MFVAAALCLGLVVGSFLNVVVHRVPRGESIVRPEDDTPPPSGAKSSVPSSGTVGIDPNPKPQPES